MSALSIEFYFRSITVLAVPSRLLLRALRAALAAALPRLEVSVFLDVDGKCLLAAADLDHRWQPSFGAQGQESAPNGAQGEETETMHAAEEVQRSQASVGAMGTRLISYSSCLLCRKWCVP